MNDRELERVSAFMDGETGSDEPSPIGGLLETGASRRTWERYHLIHDCLAGSLPAYRDPDLARRITDAIAAQPTVLAPARPRATPFARPLAGLAIAASVAAMAILTLQYHRGGAETAPVAPAVANQSASDSVAPRRLNLASGRGGAAARLQQARAPSPMNRYLVNYNEYRRSGAVQGMLPYVRIVADDTDE